MVWSNILLFFVLVLSWLDFSLKNSAQGILSPLSKKCLANMTCSFFIIFIYWFCNLLIYSFSILYIFVTSTVFCITPQILRRCGDSVELLDVSNELPELARRPGLSTWKVIHVSKTIHIKYIMLSFMIKFGFLRT